MDIKIDDQVRINCQSSRYNGLVGDVHEIQESSRYAIVLLPEGAELRVENIKQNSIRTQRSASEKRNPIPPGDPQWFPLEWLIPLRLDSEATTTEI